MKSISINRNNGYYGRVRDLKIIVDGDPVAVLKAGESKTIEIEDDAGQIWGKMDWAKTTPLDLKDLTPAQSVTFEAHFTLNPLRVVGILSIPIRVYAS